MKLIEIYKKNVMTEDKSSLYEKSYELQLEQWYFKNHKSVYSEGEDVFKQVINVKNTYKKDKIRTR